MTATRFEPAIRAGNVFEDLGLDVPQAAFTARIAVGSDGTSRGVPHVNNAEYVRWIDRLAELATDQAGFTRATMLESNRMWFVARHEIDYRGEAFDGDELHAATWLDSWTRTSVTRLTAIVEAGKPRAICLATTRWAYVDLESRRPTRIPREMRDAFPAASGSGAGGPC